MAFLIGSASTTRFSSTLTTNYATSEFLSYVIGNDSEGITAGATGTGAILSIFLNSWLTATNLKAVLYEANVKVGEWIVPASTGTGLQEIVLGSTVSITSGNLYRLALYSEDGKEITLNTDGSALTLRRENSGSGSFTTPIDPYPSGQFDSFNEFYFAFQDAPAGPVITDVNTTNTVQVSDTPTVTGTSFLATAGSQTWNAISVGVDTWADTSILSEAITRGDKAYDTNYDWVVTDNLAVDSSPLSVQLAIETGFQFIALVNPIIALVGGEITSLCYNTSPACVTGDQLRLPLLTDQGKAIDISAADGTFVITAAGNTEQTFSFELWDATGPTNEKWSLSTAAVINGVIVSGGIVRPLVSSIVSNIVKSITS